MMILFVFLLLLNFTESDVVAEEERAENVVLSNGGSAKYARVILSNKSSLSGIVVEENEDGLVLDIGGGTVLAGMDQIEEIVYIDENAAEDLFKKVSSEEKLEKEKQALEVGERALKALQIKRQRAEFAKRQKEHVIRYKDPSRILVDVILEDTVRAKFCVDTGAATVGIPMEIAKHLPDIRQRLKKGRRVTAILADGSRTPAREIILKNVKIAGLDIGADKIAASVYEKKGNNNIQGLLGMSFLSRFDIKVDSKARKLVFQRK